MPTALTGTAGAPFPACAPTSPPLHLRPLHFKPPCVSRREPDTGVGHHTGPAAPRALLLDALRLPLGILAPERGSLSVRGAVGAHEKQRPGSLAGTTPACTLPASRSHTGPAVCPQVEPALEEVGPFPRLRPLLKPLTYQAKQLVALQIEVEEGGGGLGREWGRPWGAGGLWGVVPATGAHPEMSSPGGAAPWSPGEHRGRAPAA